MKHKIELINRDRFTLEVADDQFILEAIEAAGLRLPVGCRYGACITCAARLLSGEVEQSRAVALKPAQAAKGYVLLCIASPAAIASLKWELKTSKNFIPIPLRLISE
ncbi:2Fe-2S iron-sulfur cluster-binding protein [Oscillatoria sp. FACHB-1407]|uniref:2Fe-2S iron-sulfur cluster-binding protein n=1 Tax=Oscillatoria sp. FACHB-1407 TaxID=2692847 RepID=UPI0035CCD3D2